MGLDGGTFATRSDILRRQSQRLADGDTTRSSRGGCVTHASVPTAARDDKLIRWTVCALSLEPLGPHVLACRKGWLYNRSRVHDFMLRQGRFHGPLEPALQRRFGHLRSPQRDVVELRLHRLDDDSGPQWRTKRPRLDPEQGSTDAMRPLFACPVTQLEANGAHDFQALWTCGCVFSGRAVRELNERATAAVHSPKAAAETGRLECFSCSSSFDPRFDLITLNPDDAALAKVESTLEAEQQQRAHRQEQRQKRHHQRLQELGAPPTSPCPLQSLPAAAPAAFLAIAADPGPHLASQSSGMALALHRVADQKKTHKKKTKGTATGHQRKVPEPMPLPRLPGGWERVESRSRPGAVYYRHRGLNKTQWHRPTSSIASAGNGSMGGV